ncbi:MAG: DUF5672 family protein, partial [Nanoarchaeota archaeon]
KPLRGVNGGMSYRTMTEVKKCVEYVNNKGGQHKYFSGVKINGEIKQNNSWLAEDLMFCSVGFTFDIFKEVPAQEAKKFSHEPIEYSLYSDKNNPSRPYCWHKCDN